MFKFFRILIICLVVSLVGFSMYSKKAKRRGSKGKKVGTQRLSSMRKGLIKKKPKATTKVTSKSTTQSKKSKYQTKSEYTKKNKTT